MAGSTNVSATVGGITGQASVTVNAPPTVTSVTVTPNPASCFPLGTITYDAMAHLSDGSSLDVSLLAAWTSSNPLVATAVTNVAACVLAGSTTITANYLGVMGSAPLTVTAPTP
ncbi:MAG TPA: hypothetical protein VGD60_09965 [Candidatus Acidoferrales bacterium]